MANSIFDKIGDLLGTNKTEQSTGQTTAANTQHAFTDDLVGLGSMLSNSGIGKDLLSKLDGLKSLDTQQIQTVLSALGQSSDTKVQAAKQDLASVQHDGTTFVDKLKGYATQLSGFLPAILPALQKIFAGNK